MGNDDERPPWYSPGVDGIVPPGRRLGKPGDKRHAKWAAAGVNGVVPPGNQKPGDGPGARWVMGKEKSKPKGKPIPRTASGSVDQGRPTAGFIPNVFADSDDPRNLKAFLDEIAAYFREHRPDDSALVHLSELIGQSHAPYEIIVAFTVLSTLIGPDTDLRNRYSWALERGAKAFYNLAMRLDNRVRPPRGLAPQRMDPLFYDLPPTAYKVPFAFATEAFLRMLELMRGDIGHDRAMMRFARDLYLRFVEQRSFGDKPLADMFPWEEPPWAPEDDA